MTKENWKTAYRNQRVAARKSVARAYRICRKRINSLSEKHHETQMALFAQIHLEIAPALALLYKTQEALENLGAA